MQDSVKQNRERYIGGSDIPVILGVSPYKTRFRLLLEKAQIEEDTFEGNEYTFFGNVMESKIRDYINSLDTVKEPYVEGKYVEEDDNIGIRCHTDGENKDSILEIKTTSEDNIHDRIEDYKVFFPQLLFYMMKRHKKNGHLAVYERPADMSEEFDPNRLHLYYCYLDDFKDEQFVISKEVMRFRQDLKKVKANPFISEEELLPDDLVTASNQIILMENQLAELKSLEAAIKSRKAELKELMVKYNVKTWQTPNGTKITLVPDGEDREETEEYFDMEEFKEKHPKMFKTFNKTHKIIKKGKTGFVRITLPKGEKNG